MITLEKASVPTFYFVGVTTGQSSIMKVFPKWAKALGIDAAIKGIDLPLHAPTDDYRAVAQFLKTDELSLGGLVTSHKMNLFRDSKDMFDYIDPFAKQLDEASCISKKDGKFCAYAKDPISSGKALEAFVPENFWKEHGGEVLLLGSGGSSLAMCIYFLQDHFKDNFPKKITIINRGAPRLEIAKEVLSHLFDKTEFQFIASPNPVDNDTVIATLPPYSLIVNATGLGKDTLGSPTTDNVVYPYDSLVWEINYRGDLIFKYQAEAQSKSQRLHVEDGWIYFIHGWTQVIEQVFNLSFDEKILKMLSDIAREA